VRATELIAAVSLAVDIGMAQPPETGLAVCLVAVELAERLGYEPGLMQRTFRLALLQHGHIQRIYAKTGVSTRAGATLFARGSTRSGRWARRSWPRPRTTASRPCAPGRPGTS